MIRLAEKIIAHRVFAGLVVASILVAAVLAGVETSPALVARLGHWLPVLDRLALGIFTVEVGLRLLARVVRPRDYFGDGWNIFDLVVLAVCYLPAVGAFAAVLRLARLLRLLRLVRVLPRLQLLVGALLRSLSAMGYVTLLLLLLFYVYAVAGVHLFRAADPVDFGSLPAAAFTLFRVVTLDNWGDIFLRVAAGSAALPTITYFVTFIVFGTMIILNLFIGIILNSMAETHREMEQGLARAAAGTADDELSRELEALTRECAALQSRLAALRDRRPRRN